VVSATDPYGLNLAATCHYTELYHQSGTRLQGVALIRHQNYCSSLVKSVQRLVTGWTALAPEFCSLQVVQTDSAARPVTYPAGTAGSFPRGKAATA
jgi:hypothetical protein